MAGIGVSPIVFVSLLLFAIGGAHATIFNIPRTVNVTGQVCCTQNGNCPGTPVVGATVTLTCLNPIIPGVVATTTTTAAGTFSLSTTLQINPITNNIPCLVTVQLPVSAAAACPALSTNGRLLGIVKSANQAVGVLIGTVPNFIRSFV